jgi:hypothetical protein
MVTTEERVMTLLAQANPIPDLDSFDLIEVDGTRYLANLNRRSSEMTGTDSKPAEVVTMRRRPLVALALTAAAVLVVGAAAWLGLNREDLDVASAGVAVVEEFARAVSSGATDLSEDVTDGATFGPMAVPLDNDLASFWAALDTTLTVSNCAQSAQVVRCDYEWTDRIRQAQDRPEFGVFTFLMDGSRIAAISGDVDQEASGWLKGAATGNSLGADADPVVHYLAWLNQAYPGWELELDWNAEPAEIGGGFAPLGHDDPVHNARYAEVLTRHLDEYAQELNATGGLPD